MVIKAAAVHVGNGTIVTDGAILIRNGRVVKVGKNLAIPDGATVIDVPSGTITPGLIDANAAIERSDMMTGGFRGRFGPKSPRAVLHDFFCPTHAQEPVAGCCGSSCSRAHEHINITLGEAPKCSECGFPDAPVALVVGTRIFPSPAEHAAEVVPHMRVLDTVNLRSPDLDRLLSGGVTTVFVAPDSASVISSQGAIIRTGGPVTRRVVSAASAVKASMGTDPSWRGARNRPPFRSFVDFHTRRPTTRMGVTWVFRKAFHDAIRQRDGLATYGADVPSDAALDVLNQVLAGRIPLRIQARQQQDIITALRLTEEFGLAFVLEEATEAYRCLPELSARNVPVIFGPIYISAPGYRARSAETQRARLHTLRALLDARIETALTAHELRDEDGLARQAMYALRFGVPLDRVMRSVTQTPAKLMGVADQFGTLEKGKRADVLVWSGEPFAATSRPVLVVMDGSVVLDRR